LIALDTWLKRAIKSFRSGGFLWGAENTHHETEWAPVKPVHRNSHPFLAHLAKDKTRVDGPFSEWVAPPWSDWSPPKEPDIFEELFEKKLRRKQRPRKPKPKDFDYVWGGWGRPPIFVTPSCDWCGEAAGFKASRVGMPGDDKYACWRHKEDLDKWVDEFNKTFHAVGKWKKENRRGHEKE